MWYSQEQQTGRQSQLQRFPPRSEGSHNKLPSPRALQQKVEHLALKARGTGIQENRRALGNRDAALKGQKQNLHML